MSAMAGYVCLESVKDAFKVVIEKVEPGAG